MKLKDHVIVVTGGANGIGAALCGRFAREAPSGIVVADIDYEQCCFPRHSVFFGASSQRWVITKIRRIRQFPFDQQSNPR